MQRRGTQQRCAWEAGYGEFIDYADVARHHNLTRARLTQIMNLLLLAPDIQEQILSMEAETGREPISARDLRKVLRTMDWEKQRRIWEELTKPTLDDSRRCTLCKNDLDGKKEVW